MGIADDIRSLAQDIANSYDTRIEWITGLRKETAKMLDEFGQEHKKMATEWRKLVTAMQEKREQAPFRTETGQAKL